MPTRLPGPAVWLTILAVIILGLGASAMLNGQAAKRKAEAAAKTEAPTPFAAVAQGKADVEGGVIQVASRTPGVVREVDVIEGDHVTKGQVLARQEDDAQRLAVETATANLNQIRSQIGAIEVQLATAQRQHGRYEPLGSGVVSQEQIDESADAIRSAQARLAAERAAIGVARAQLDEARYRLEQTVIRAPTDGLIVRRYANPGTGASTLNVTPMFDLEPAGQRIVRAEVSETALPSVIIGQPVQIATETDQSKTYPGRVLRQAGVFGARKLQSDDPSERTDDRVVEVVVSADNAPFLVGQRVLVKFLKRRAGAG